MFVEGYLMYTSLVFAMQYKVGERECWGLDELLLLLLVAGMNGYDMYTCMLFTINNMSILNPIGCRL